MAHPTHTRPPIYPQVQKKGPYTVEPENAEHISGETLPRRHPTASTTLLSCTSPGILTIYDILTRSVRKFHSAPAIGSRRVLRTHTETKKVKDGRGELVDKTWTYYELSDYSYTSFAELERRAVRLGAAMRGVGLERGDRIAIYGATSGFWFTVAHGAASQSITTVTAYV